jgi:hypothetical protein
LEAQSADRTRILTAPHAFAFPACHHGLEAEFFGSHIRICLDHKEDSFLTAFHKSGVMIDVRE